MRRLLREPLVHFLLIGAVLFGLYSLTQSGRPATAPSKEIRLSLDEIAPAHPALPVAVAPPADAAGARAHGREQGPAGNPLPRGARDGPRQGRRDRQAPHGAEDAVPGRGRGRRARADDGRAQELVREEQRQVRAAAAAELPASVLLARPARRPRARRCGAGAREARRPAGGREDRELARRPVHVPGLLPRSRARLSRQGIRTAVRAGGREASAGLVAGARSSPASAGTSSSSTP